MRKRCVVYLRVSTTEQTLGSGLIRQLETCTRFARDNGLLIACVFGDACSGDGPMPNRQLAFDAATRMRCPILVETRCRWSRMSYGTDPLQDAPVILTSPTEAEFEETCWRILQDERDRMRFLEAGKKRAV